MALMDWFSHRTPLRLALERGTKPGADLADELRKLQEFSIESKADAEAVCGVLREVAQPGSNVGGSSALYEIISLFRRVEGPDCPAFSVLAEQGTPLLAQIVDDALLHSGRLDSDAVLFALAILAGFGTPEGTNAVIRAARMPLQPDAYMWALILQAYTAGHGERTRLFEELSNPLPPDFLAVALIDSGNAAKRAGAADPHPFDSPAGIKQLECWLTNKDETHFSYAVSATAALPFIDRPERDGLLAIAFDHVDAGVQLEAAWAAASLGREAGINWLTRACLDFNLAVRAKHFLNELGRADAIPAESEDADFRAKAEFAQWLAHPSELGRFPEELEIVDHRELPWPPARTPKPMWLLRYRVKDTTGLKDDAIGVGLVGSITMCFGYKLEQHPPEDAYAIHCFWEMKRAGLITTVDVEEDSREYDRMLRQCTLDGLSQQRMGFVAEISPELKYPQNLVGLATASRNGEAGWIVLDGPRSRWYPTAGFPDGTYKKTVLDIHVGRVLLGFAEEPERRKFLEAAPSKRNPEQIIAAYERLVAQGGSDSVSAMNLLGTSSVLGAAFEDYVSALAITRSQSAAVCTCAAYESLLFAAAKVTESLHGKQFESFSPLGSHLEKYVDALIEMNRRADVPALIEKFRPHFDHNLGYATLGNAAFKSGHYPLAEGFFLKLRHSSKDWFRCKEMNALADILSRQGRAAEAQSMLIDALHGLLDQSRKATGSDRKLLETCFQDRKSAYLRIFPSLGEGELQRQRVPPSTLTDTNST
jgi:hypothetical protein